MIIVDEKIKLIVLAVLLGPLVFSVVVMTLIVAFAAIRDFIDTWRGK